MISTPEQKVYWKPIGVMYDKTIQEIEDRKSGKTKSYKTPWKNLNKELMNGLEWGTMGLVAAGSGVGKTAILEQIINEGPDLNPDQTVAVLKYQFEMTEAHSGAREFTGPTGLSIKQMFSAEENFELEDGFIDRLKDIAKDRSQRPIFYVNEFRSVEQMKKEIMLFCQMAKKTYGKDVGIIVTIDHTLLIKKAVDESGAMETLSNLGIAVLDIKKKEKIIILLLNQFNNEIEDERRKEPGRLANFPKRKDVYLGNSIFFAVDFVIAVMRPAKEGMTNFGPKKWIMTPEHMLFFILKNRFDENSVLHFKTNFKNFRIEESTEPESNK